MTYVTAPRPQAPYFAGMQDEHSSTTNEELRERRRRARLDFLIAELQTGHVSASLAMTSTHPANAARYCHFAREAYGAVVRFWPTLPLRDDEDELIRSQLASLELKIEELAQLQR